MEAITREEKIMSGENLTPITRKEMFLAKAAGQNIETPEPITREEMFLSKISGGGGGSGGEEWIGDGNTYIWITLQEGRTSPMLGVCPKGTVTVDWGDGTTPDLLTGTSVTSVKWTPTHEYATAGDYVIKLTVDGEMGFYGTSSSNDYSAILRYSSGADARNGVYQNSVQKIEMGNGVTSIGNYAFYDCYSLVSVTISDSVTSIGSKAFQNCQRLRSITIPDSVTSIGDTAFQNCYSLESVTMPDSVTYIGGNAFQNCYSFESVTIPDSVTYIGGSAFQKCQRLRSITISNSVTSIGGSVFVYCYSLESVTIPDGVTSIGNYAFQGCRSLVSVTISDSVTSIGSSAFQGCYGMRYCDFTKHTSVPMLTGAYGFYDIPADCEIRVPEALYDKWIAATNWSEYASKIVAV